MLVLGLPDTLGDRVFECPRCTQRLLPPLPPPEMDGLDQQQLTSKQVRLLTFPVIETLVLTSHEHQHAWRAIGIRRHVGENAEAAGVWILGDFG
jgi:hypothetical protein